MSKVAPNFGRTAYTEPVADDIAQNAPANVQGLRRDATGLIVVSTIIGCWFPPLGAGGVLAGLLWLLATKPATVTTNNMASARGSGDRSSGCFWYVATLLIGIVAFVAGLFVIGAFAMAGR